MSQPGQQISKRAKHKLDVASRKTQPIVKRSKLRKRKRPARLSVSFFAMAAEQEREGVYMTRVQKKPTRWFLESYDANSEKITGAMQANPKGQRGYTLMLEGGGIHEFKTQRRALKFFSRLEKLVPEVAETPVEDPALDQADVAIVSPAEHAALQAACDAKCETNNKGCVTHNRRIPSGILDIPHVETPNE